MDFRAFVEPQQGAGYAEQSAVAHAAEELGFDAFFRSDHYLAMSGDGMPGPTDSWVTLGAIARETSRIRLGTLVTSATFRYPGPLAIAVAQVDEMSGGRVEFGLGSGWFEEEHRAYGIPFPPVRERFYGSPNSSRSSPGFGPRRLARRSTSKASTTRSPIHRGFPNRPKPTSPDRDRRHRRQTYTGAGAETAAEFNVPFAPIDVVRTQVQRVADAVAAADRTADSIVDSSAFVLLRRPRRCRGDPPRLGDRPRGRRNAFQQSAGRHARRDRRQVGPLGRIGVAAGLRATAGHVRLGASGAVGERSDAAVALTDTASGPSKSSAAAGRANARAVRSRWRLTGVALRQGVPLDRTSGDHLYTDDTQLE